MKKEKNARAEEAILSVNKSRREFIKTATAGAGGMAVYPLVSSSANASASSAKSFLSQKTVTVTFEGLMIFHYRRDVEEYEVGILALPRPHIFAINADGSPITLPTPIVGRPWRLQVIDNSTGRPRRDINPTELHHDPERLLDSNAGQFDFSWIADFESLEFHADLVEHRELSMTPNLLKPIIHLSNGRLYTKYKIEKLTRNQGGGSAFPDFGFMTETVALEVSLNSGEALVLKVENVAQNGDVFHFRYEELPTTIAVENTIPKAQRRPDDSHFHLYYDLLFPNVSARNKQYDIKLKDPQELPINYHPDRPRDKVHPITIGSYPCGAIYLGTRQSDLA